MQPRAIEGVAPVVGGPIRNGTHKGPRFIQLAQQPFGHLAVRPFLLPGDVVDTAHLAVVEDKSDGIRMIVHMQPVTTLLAVAVQRQRLIVHGIGYEQRDELLRMLARAVGVRAARDKDVES